MLVYQRVNDMYLDMFSTLSHLLHVRWRVCIDSAGYNGYNLSWTKTNLGNQQHQQRIGIERLGDFRYYRFFQVESGGVMGFPKFSVMKSEFTEILGKNWNETTREFQHQITSTLDAPTRLHKAQFLGPARWLLFLPTGGWRFRMICIRIVILQG